MLIFSVLRNVGFVHQTLHKPYTELYIELFTERCTNPHVEVRKTLPFREGFGVGLEKPFPLGRGLG